MYNNLEEMFSQEQRELYLEIMRKSIEELNIPVKSYTWKIGFGSIASYYMYYINEKHGTVFFVARKEFVRSRKLNLTIIEFIPENKEAIFSAIDNIYNSYLEAQLNGNLQRDIDRVESKKARKAALAKNTETPPAIKILWEDVTSLVVEASSKILFDDEIDEDAVSALERCGEYFLDLVDKILHAIKCTSYGSLSRNLSIYAEYIETDKTTLAEIASMHNLSRERIRQVINRVDSHISYYFNRTMLIDNTEFNELLEQLAVVFEAVEHRIPLLISYGLANISARKKEAILKMLFGKELSEKLIELAPEKALAEKSESAFENEDEITPSKKIKSIRSSKSENALDDWDKFQSKISFPSYFTADISACIVSCEKEYSYTFERKFYKKLKNFESVVDIIENPDIVYYSSVQTDHRPNFLLRLPDGKSALVVVAPTVNMAFFYNIERFNGLHRFCKENGYGYLIMDDRGNSIYDVKNKEVDPKIAEHFDAVLKNKGKILWEDIKGIKLEMPVLNIDIAAYVLQSKLYFTKKPYCIKKREEGN